MTFKYLLAPESLMVVSLTVTLIVSVVRAINGGTLFDPDRVVRDGIAGVVIFAVSLLWYGTVINPEALEMWSKEPLGKLSITMTILGIVVARLDTLSKSMRNI